MGTVLRDRAADTARRLAMRMPAGHAQDRRHTRTRTRHPQGRQAAAHGSGRARMVAGRHRHGPEGQPHRGSAGHTGGVRRMPVLRARRRMGRAQSPHGRMPFLRRAGEPHLRGRPAARQARPIREEGHAQTDQPGMRESRHPPARLDHPHVDPPETAHARRARARHAQ